MARTVNSRVTGKMSPTRVTLSPSFQPYRSASGRPTMAAVRSAMNAFFCSSGTLYSGWVMKIFWGSTAKRAKKFLKSLSL